ncbi:MAG: gluconate 2-dehydrogenase subunit 3 family protein [Bacteroidetes bacterium]|nr:gluconate 2-dehydrogenase subunit 3 family protein [Bacteroidota bacterium]MDA1268946.1 gluconate 2-dehydrogenase subunit 3 family protein [Bacteroidota bacterium]
MQRRTSLKLLGAAGVGIAGLVLADWKWQILDRLTHIGFFTYEQEQLLASLADTIIPEGVAGAVGTSPIGALSTGTDQFLIRFFEKCLEKEEQEIILQELKVLQKLDFSSLSKEEREKILQDYSKAEGDKQKKFYKLIRSNTIFGFTTARDVMVDHLGYQVAPGFYSGCVEVSPEKS